MTDKREQDVKAAGRPLGTFARAVSHDAALQAAMNFINAHFKNKGNGVLTSIPASPDNDDLVLVDYIKQQRALRQPASVEAEPVAWAYEPKENSPVLVKAFVQPARANMDSRYWTETPLYAHPPADAEPVALLRECRSCLTGAPDPEHIAHCVAHIDAHLADKVQS